MGGGQSKTSTQFSPAQAFKPGRRNPAISASENGRLAIAVYLDNNQNEIYCCVGKLQVSQPENGKDSDLIEWSNSEQLIAASVSCSTPSVAITNDGTIVLAYRMVSEYECYYQLGRIEVNDSNSIRWEEATSLETTSLGSGSNLTVSLAESSGHSTIVLGVVSKEGSVYVKIGKLDAGTKVIGWLDEKLQQFSDLKSVKELSLSLNKHNVLVAAYSTTLSEIFMIAGIIELGNIPDLFKALSYRDWYM